MTSVLETDQFNHQLRILRGAFKPGTQTHAFTDPNNWVVIIVANPERPLALLVMSDLQLMAIPEEIQTHQHGFSQVSTS